ncbi:MAG: hypothetical protein ACI9E1_001831, partial [Cryomorphaceae bacterium]
MHKKTLIAATLGLASLTMNSSAVEVLEPKDVLTGLNGQFTISEYDIGDIGESVGYAVDVLGSTTIAAFAVSHNDSFTSGVISESCSLAGWSSITASQSVWDNTIEEELIFQINGTPIAANGLGLFSDLFGTDTYATVYWTDLDSSNNINENNDTDGPAFEFDFSRDSAQSASDFIVFDGSGTILDGSNTSAVPEPSSALL